MTAIIIWWIIAQLLGWVTLPVAMRFFRWLPDRGYVFSKPLGLLLVSYVVWLLGSFGLLRNEAVSILGGYGYMREYVVERLARDAKLLEIGAGTTEMQIITMGQELATTWNP